VPRAALNGYHLACFQAVMAAGSIRGAADRLGVEPSVVSRQVRQLQADLGVVLLERRGRGVVPTEAAGLVVEHCREQVASERTLRSDLQDLGGLRRGHLHVVAGDGFIEEFLAQILGPFQARHPGITLVLESLGAGDIVQAVAEDRAHVGLTLSAPTNGMVSVIHERRQPLRVVASPDNLVMQGTGPLRLAQILEQPLALAAHGTGLRSLVRAAEVLEQVTLEPSFTANSVATLKQFAVQGLGITLLSGQAVRQEVAAGRLAARPTDNAILQGAAAQLLLRRGCRVSAALQELLTMIVASGLFANECCSDRDAGAITFSRYQS